VSENYRTFIGIPSDRFFEKPRLMVRAVGLLVKC